MANIGFIAPGSSAVRVDQADRRQSERTYTVFRVARLILPEGDQLGIVRNISEHGIMLELQARISVGDRVTLDLGEGHRLVGDVRWCDAAAAGLSFIEPINVAGVLGKAAAGADDADGKVPRLPRVRTDSPAEITLATCTAPARVVNISIGGACVETDAPVAPHQQIALTIPSLPTKVGTVRWRRGKLAGIVFGRPLSVQTLMEWLATRQQAQPPALPERDEPAVRLSDTRLADLYLSSIDQLAMVIVTDRSGMIVRANQRFQRFSGCSSDQLVGMNLFDLEGVRLAKGLIEAMAAGETWRGEIAHADSTGAPVVLNAMIAGSTHRPDLFTCFLFESTGQTGNGARTAALDHADDADETMRLAAQGTTRSTAASRKGGKRKTVGSPGLSRRELQVLRRVANGLSNEEIGAEIGLSRRTVEIYRASLLDKLGARNTASAVMIACKLEII